jgi:hypothetical protein
MRTVTVSMVGADHQHSFTTNASSLFDACRQAVQGWATYWWYRTDSAVEAGCAASEKLTCGVGVRSRTSSIVRG